MRRWGTSWEPRPRPSSRPPRRLPHQHRLSPRPTERAANGPARIRAPGRSGTILGPRPGLLPSAVVHGTPFPRTVIRVDSVRVDAESQVPSLIVQLHVFRSPVDLAVVKGFANGAEFRPLTAAKMLERATPVGEVAEHLARVPGTIALLLTRNRRGLTPRRIALWPRGLGDRRR